MFDLRWCYKCILWRIRGLFLVCWILHIPSACLSYLFLAYLHTFLYWMYCSPCTHRLNSPVVVARDWQWAAWPPTVAGTGTRYPGSPAAPRSTSHLEKTCTGHTSAARHWGGEKRKREEGKKCFLHFCLLPPLFHGGWHAGVFKSVVWCQ